MRTVPEPDGPVAGVAFRQQPARGPHDAQNTITGSTPLIPLAGWITPVGVLVLVFDGGPAWLGIALIIAGALLARALARRTAAAERSSAGAAG